MGRGATAGPGLGRPRSSGQHRFVYERRISFPGRTPLVGAHLLSMG